MLCFKMILQFKNNHRGVLLLVKLHTKACFFPKHITSPWVSLTCFKVNKWYQIAQSVSYGKTLSVKVSQLLL